jgi:hypothetical protein
MTADTSLPTPEEFDDESPEAIEMPDFEEEDEFDPFDGVDPETIVTIRPGAGDPQYLVIEEAAPFNVLMQRAGLTFNGQINMYVEGVEIGYEDLVQPGQTVTVIGNVKGGLS